MLEQLLAVGQRQSELINEGDLPTLLQLLSTKQRLILALRSTENELAPYQQEDPEARVWPSPESRAECAADAEVCNRLLPQVVALEKSHEEQMTTRRDEVSAQLQQAQSAQVASSAYQPHARHTPSITPPKGVNLAASLDLTTEQ